MGPVGLNKFAMDLATKVGADFPALRKSEIYQSVDTAMKAGLGAADESAIDYALRTICRFAVDHGMSFAEASQLFTDVSGSTH